MNYLTSLSNDEIEELCKIIGGIEFKKMFVKNPKGFSQIKPGFRPNTLSDDDALQIAIKNHKAPFVSGFINTVTDTWMGQISNNLSKLEENGMLQEQALAETILDSVFAEQLELYCKLSGKGESVEKIRRIVTDVEIVKRHREEKSNLEKNASELQAEVEGLRGQLSQLQKELDSSVSKCRSDAEEYEREKKSLKKELSDALTQIEALRSPYLPVADVIDSYEQRIKYDDTMAVNLPPIASNDFLSLCEVASDYNGRKYLLRHADIDHAGQYTIFRRNENVAPIFENRSKLFLKNGPKENGCYGVWQWFATPNDSDPSKDYISSKYDPAIVPIEVVIVSNCSSMEELVKKLQEGVSTDTKCQKVLFSAQIDSDKFVGALCYRRNFTISSGISGIVKLSEDVDTVPIYEFARHEIMRLNNGRTFYQSIFAGIPSCLYLVKPPLEIVRDIVLNSISWPIYKQRGASHAEYNKFKDFLLAISLEDVVDKVSVACHCTYDHAEQLLDQFTKRIDNFIDGNGFDDEIISSAILSNTTLMSRAKQLIYDDWEKENKLLLSDAQRDLDELRIQMDGVSNQLELAQEKLKITKEENDNLTSSIARNKQLASDVESAVSSRIQQAKDNVSEFIANMAFVGDHVVNIGNNEPQVNFSAASPASYRYVSIEPVDDKTELECNENWSDVLDTIELELLGAGVEQNHARGLGAFLCSAYIVKQPLLIVGPNSRDIVEAFSASLFAKKQGVLYCGGEYVGEICQKIGGSDNDVIEIVNLISSGWMNNLPDILSEKDVFFIATHPFAEDIQVEPKSLYGYMLPVCTEFFVDKRPSGKYLGGYLSDEFECYKSDDKASRKIKIPANLDTNPLVSGNIRRLLTVMHNINGEAAFDDDFLYSFLPFGYVTMNVESLLESANDPQNGIEISSSLQRELRYIMGT